MTCINVIALVYAEGESKLLSHTEDSIQEGSIQEGLLYIKISELRSAPCLVIMRTRAIPTLLNTIFSSLFQHCQVTILFSPVGASVWTMNAETDCIERLWHELPTPRPFIDLLQFGDHYTPVH